MGITSEQLDAILKDPMAASEQLDKLFEEPGNEGETAAASPAAEPEAKDAAPKPEPVAEPQGESEKPKPDATEPDPDKSVILTKDGKHQIPYSVLQRERERANALERQLQETIAKTQSLQAEAKGGDKDTTADVERLNDEQMADLESEAPTLAKAFKALYARIDQLETQSQQTAAHAQQQVKDAVRESIDAVPKLAYVESQDVEAFNEIARIDIQLRQNPKWAGKPMQERFEKAVAMYEAAYGEIQTPNASGEGDKPGKPEDAAAKAKEVLDKAAEKALPNTLTDIPGGNPPAANDLEAIGQKSAAALTAMFEGMTDDQMNAYLARL